jgi:hypothetical protein
MKNVTLKVYTVALAVMLSFIFGIAATVGLAFLYAAIGGLDAEAEVFEAPEPEGGDAPAASPEPALPEAPAASPEPAPPLSPAPQLPPPANPESDLYTYTVMLGGEAVRLPAPWGELEALGWAGKEDFGRLLLSPRYLSYNVNAAKDGRSVRLRFLNLGLDKVPYSESLVWSIRAEVSEFKKNGLSFVLPGGVSLESGYDDMLAAYGEPTAVTETDKETVALYSSGEYSAVEFRFDKESRALKSIDVRNDEEVVAWPAFEGEFIDNVLAYRAPESVGKSWDSFAFAYGGDLCQLPVPVARFMENGWALLGDPNEKVAAGQAGEIKMRKDNQTVSFAIRNLDDDFGRKVANCFVMGAAWGGESGKPPFELTGGVTETSLLEDVKAAYGEPDSAEEADPALRWVYEKPNGQLSFSFDSETGEIISLELTRNAL